MGHRRLEEYLVKGFAMDDARLKQTGGGDYFEELPTRIRDIRSSERVFYRKVLDIYATSIDYDGAAELSAGFFRVMQNKCTGPRTASPPIFQPPSTGFHCHDGRRPPLPIEPE